MAFLSRSRRTSIAPLCVGTCTAGSRLPVVPSPQRSSAWSAHGKLQLRVMLLVPANRESAGSVPATDRLLQWWCASSLLGKACRADGKQIKAGIGGRRRHNPVRQASRVYSPSWQLMSGLIHSEAFCVHSVEGLSCCPHSSSLVRSGIRRGDGRGCVCSSKASYQVRLTFPAPGGRHGVRILCMQQVVCVKCAIHL